MIDFKRKTITLLTAIMLIVSMTVPSWAASSATRPQVTAKGAVVYCENTGEVVYSHYMNRRLDPLSVTKLMTVMLAVQYLPLDREVTVSADAAAQGESTMGLVAGEKLTVRDLIYGALLPSGNDAAYALGEAVSGDMKSFLKLMNDTAENIGCENTHFANPNGLKVKNHYSTAYDIMQIARVAFSNSVVAKVAGTREYTVPATNKSGKRVLKSHVSFIENQSTGIYAGKTGYWDDGNASIALGYEKDGLRMIIVVLGDQSAERTTDVKAMLKYATSKVTGIKVIDEGKAAGKVRVKHGAKTRIEAYAGETGYAYLPKEASKSLISTKTEMNEVTAPVRKGDIVGKYEIYVAGDLVNEVDLVAQNDVQVGWFTSYLGISNMAAVILLLILLVVLCLMIFIIIARARYKRKKKLERQRRIKEMARRQLEKEQDQEKRGWTF